MSAPSPLLPVLPAPPDKPALLGTGRARLRELLAPYVDHAYRADQVYEALHRQGVERWDEVTTLPKALRAELAERFAIGAPEVVRRHEAADGTVKLLLRLADGASIEAVDIPEGDRRTLCLSSQAGCALGCSFCVTPVRTSNKSSCCMKIRNRRSTERSTRSQRASRKSPNERAQLWVLVVA